MFEKVKSLYRLDQVKPVRVETETEAESGQ